jgi:hypothetical protein
MRPALRPDYGVLQRHRAGHRGARHRGACAELRPDAHGGRLHARPARGRGHRARAVAKGHRRWHAAVDAARSGQKQGEQEALELLAWMVARGTSKSRSPCLATRTATPWRPRHLPREGRRHRGQDRQPLAFAGSINETAYGWLHNWESRSTSSATGTVAPSTSTPRNAPSRSCGRTSPSAPRCWMCRLPCAKTCCALCRQTTMSLSAEARPGRQAAR